MGAGAESRREELIMSRSRLLCGLLLAGLIAFLVLQKNAISKVRVVNESLRQEQEEAAGLAEEKEPSLQLQAANHEMEQWRTAHQNLLKLRSEVRQLRAQETEVEKLREENRRLAAATRAMADGKPLRFSDMEGYVAKETWSNAGLATPEAALQTFLWAVREGQIQPIAECMSPEARPWFEREFAQMPEQERHAALQQGLGQLTRTGGYRLGSKEEPSPDKVVLGLQAVAGGVVAKVVFQRFGADWKFHGLDAQ